MSMNDHSHHHMGPSPQETSTISNMIAAQTTNPTSGLSNSAMGHDDMMKPYFHFTTGDTILFKGIVLESTESAIICCVLFFFLGFLYEGLKVFREILLRKASSCRARSAPCQAATPVEDTSGGPLSNDRINDFFARSPDGQSCREKIFNMPHTLQTLLHILQVTISYILMLAFMSFNGYLCIAIVLGAGAGYFTFCWRNLSVTNLDHCN